MSLPSARERLLDPESVRTSLALVLFDPRRFDEDESLFSRCVIEEPPPSKPWRPRRGAWLAVVAGLAAVLLGAALLLGGKAARQEQGLEVRIDRAHNVVEIWIKEG